MDRQEVNLFEHIIIKYQSVIMKYILAIDSGGTKTEALLVQEDGVPVGWGRYDASSKGSRLSVSGGGRSRESIVAAIEQAMGDCVPEELYVKYGYGSVTGDCFPIKCEIKNLAIAEYTGALALAGETCGIVALSGTGAFVRGETRDGRTLHLDGFGPNLGDYGSGYQIGIQAIRAAARSNFHPRHSTALVDPVLEKCLGTTERKSVHDLIYYMLQLHDRAEIAALAKVVDKVAEEGDQIAVSILKQSAAGLAETLFDVVDRLGMASEDYVLVGSGSVCTKSRIYWEELCALAEKFAPALRPVRLDMPNVVGEALTMLRQVDPADWHEKRLRLLSEVPALIAASSEDQVSTPAAKNAAG